MTSRPPRVITAKAQGHPGQESLSELVSERVSCHVVPAWGRQGSCVLLQLSVLCLGTESGGGEARGQGDLNLHSILGGGGPVGLRLCKDHSGSIMEKVLRDLEWRWGGQGARWHPWFRAADPYGVESNPSALVPWEAAGKTSMFPVSTRCNKPTES